MHRWIALVVALAAVSCGKDAASPTAPSGSPSFSTWPLNGIVTETEPTTVVPIANATATVADGRNVGQTTLSDGSGNFSFPSLRADAFTLMVSAPGYEASNTAVNLSNGPRSISIRLMPVFQMITSTRNESISGGDPICLTNTPCKAYTLSLHHAGGISATVTWNDSDTWLWLRLSRADGLELAEASSSRSTGLRQTISANVSGAQQYVLTVRYLLGARVTPFVLTASRPS